MSNNPDVYRSEFEGGGVEPASSETLGVIGGNLAYLSKDAHPHVTLDYGTYLDSNPVLFRHHLEQEYINDQGVDWQWPLHEVIMYDKTCDRTAVTYKIYEDGFVFRRPGHLNGYDWDTSEWEYKGDGDVAEVIFPADQDHPRRLNEVEINALSHIMSDVLGVDRDPSLSAHAAALQAANIASSRGAYSIHRDEIQFAEGKVFIPSTQEVQPGLTYNSQIFVKTVDRSLVHPALASALKYGVELSFHRPDESREIVALDIFENGQAKFNRDVDDCPIPSVEEILGNSDTQDLGSGIVTLPYNDGKSMQERIDGANEAIARKYEEEGLGLDFASESQGRYVAKLLKNMMPGVKWWLTDPSAAAPVTE